MALTFNKHLSFICWNRAGNTGRGQEDHVSPPPALPPPLFGIAKRKGKQRKIESFKAETIKKLSPRPKCYYFSHSRAPRIQTFFLVSQSRWPAGTFQCSMTPPPWNPFRSPCEISNMPSCSAFEYTSHSEKIQI